MQQQFRQLEKALQTAAAQNNLDTMLDHVIAISSALSLNCNAASRIFGSPELDNICGKIGQLSLSQITSEKVAASPKKDCVFLASDLELQDGCALIIEELVAAQPEKRSLILLTNLSEQSVSDKVRRHFENLSVDILIAPDRLSLYDRLQWTQSQLVDISPTTLFLFNQAHDAVAVSAAAAARAAGATDTLFFFHHRDHGFTLGTFLPSARHVDFRSAGFSNCRLNLGITDNAILPLTLRDVDEVRTRFITSGKLVTATSGDSAKFEQPYLYSLAEIIPRIIQTTKGKHIHIGALSPDYLDRIDRNLLAENIDPQHFVHLPAVETLSSTLSKYEADIFIDSFPVGSCFALIEAMSIGMPFVTHHNYQSRLFANVDLVYENAPSWCEPADLCHLLSNLTNDELETLGRVSRQYYENNWTNQSLKEALAKLSSHTPESKDLKYYRRNDLQAFFDQTATVTKDHKKRESLLNSTVSQLSGSKDILFGNAVRLIEAYLHKSSEGLEVSALWKGEQQPQLGTIVAVHVLNENGEIIAQADHPLNEALLYKGEVWRDTFTLKNEQLIGAVQIGIAVFDNPQNLLPIQGGNCDWDNRRLLLPLREFCDAY